MMTYPLWGYLLWAVWALALGFWLYETVQLHRLRKRYERLIQERRQAIDLYKVERADIQPYGRNGDGSKVSATERKD